MTRYTNSVHFAGSSAHLTGGFRGEVWRSRALLVKLERVCDDCLFFRQALPFRVKIVDA